MKITGIRLGRVTVPLKKPFVTSLRTVTVAEDVVIKLETDSSIIGYGSATATVAITGETLESIESTLQTHLIPRIIGKHLEDLPELLKSIDNAVPKNTSAKASLVTALYDARAQLDEKPLFQYLGGAKSSFVTDITISMKSPAEMAQDAMEGIESGFDTLKLKLGSDVATDFERVLAVRNAVGSKVILRLDANQGWSAEDAILIIRRMEKANLQIEFVEQPVKAKDYEGLKHVTTSVRTPIAADESMFSPEDALDILTHGRAQILNIKLAKAGGFHQALKICEHAVHAGAKCMISSMLETSLGINAALALAGSQSVFAFFDLDAGILQTENPLVGGAVFRGKDITLSKEYGMGIKDVLGFKETQFIST